MASSILAWLSLYIRGAENMETQIRIRMVNPLIIRPTYVNKYIAEKWNVKSLNTIRSIYKKLIAIIMYDWWLLNLPTANFRDSTKSSTRKTPLSFLSRVFRLVASRSVSSNTLSEEIVVSVSKYFYNKQFYLLSSWKIVLLCLESYILYLRVWIEGLPWMGVRHPLSF